MPYFDFIRSRRSGLMSQPATISNSGIWRIAAMCVSLMPPQPMMPMRTLFLAFLTFWVANDSAPTDELLIWDSLLWQVPCTAPTGSTPGEP